MKIALLGAESTGKTALAGALAAQLRSQGRSVEVVAEVLREWCAREGRTPRPQEQLSIAREQELRVDAAAARAGIVIADTTAVMVAVYSAMLFADSSLLSFALERQRRYDVTLVTGLDLPWVADGLQRDGPHVREPVDAQVRAALDSAGVAYRVVYGRGRERLLHALNAIESIATSDRLSCTGADSDSKTGAWSWSCGKCGDAACEHRLFSGLGLGKASSGG
ncbi:MAG: ATP-binding protein [Ramlibacter sp.]